MEKLSCPKLQARIFLIFSFIHILYKGIKLVKQIGRKIQDATGEKLSTFYLLQSISMAIQRGNAICVTTCVKNQSLGLEGLFNFQVQEAEEL